jgi:hypothetical protein
MAAKAGAARRETRKKLPSLAASDYSKLSVLAFSRERALNVRP